VLWEKVWKMCRYFLKNSLWKKVRKMYRYFWKNSVVENNLPLFFEK